MPPDAASGTSRIVIRPGSRVLAAFRHLNYRPWFALAEFVDNAVQSFNTNRERLAEAGCPRVTVRIEVDASSPGRIAVRDDAAGIAGADFARAFKPAELPPDASGLSEFGMGMKSAACWFAPRWTVRTSALGEPIQRTVRFDIPRIAELDPDELDVEAGPSPAGSHFTEVVLEDPFAPIAGRTLGKIKEHLADIYRCQIRDGSLVLEVKGEVLSYKEPEVLQAPFYREPASQPVIWRREIDLDLGGGQHARGFAALLKKGKGARAGFALFRRNRLIQGSGDEGWKHPEVFGSPNGYRYQRLFGELHLDGFEVSHTKDGFRWEDEPAFAELLADELDKPDMPLLKQGEGHRQNAERPLVQRSAAVAVSNANEDMQERLEAAMPPAAEQAEAGEPPGDGGPAPAVPSLAGSELNFEFRGSRWTVVVRVYGDDAHGEWLEVGDAAMSDGSRRIDIRLAGGHPFMVRFAHKDPEVMQALVRVAASMGLAEALLRSTGGGAPSAVRRTVNEILKDVFSSI